MRACSLMYVLVRLSACWFVFWFVGLFIRVSLFAPPFACPFVCSCGCLFVCLFVCLCLCVCLFDCSRTCLFAQTPIVQVSCQATPYRNISTHWHTAGETHVATPNPWDKTRIGEVTSYVSLCSRGTGARPPGATRRDKNQNNNDKNNNNKQNNKPNDNQPNNNNNNTARLLLSITTQRDAVQHYATPRSAMACSGGPYSTIPHCTAPYRPA